MTIGMLILALATFQLAFLYFIETKIYFIISSMIARLLMGISKGFFVTPVYALVP